MAFDWLSPLLGGLFGGVTGAVAGYFAGSATDHRRRKEAAKAAEKEFRDIQAQMPDLIAEMKADLSAKGNEHIREFFVLPHERVRLGGSKKPRFAYYENKHDNLRGKLDILEDKGYLIDVTPGNTPIYKMTEDFVALVRKHG